MLIYRAVADKDTDNFTAQQILQDEFLLQTAISCIDKHIANGNYSKDKFWLSFTSNFIVAYNYAKPSIYRNARTTKQYKKNVKIRRSKISVIDYNKAQQLEKIDATKPIIIDVVANVDKLSTRAANYGKGSNEFLLLGTLDNSVIKNITFLQSDLLYLLLTKAQDGTQYNITSHLNCLNDLDVFERAEANLKLNLIEKIIYKLFFVDNKNLYEIIAPLYYANDIDITFLYGLVLDIIKSILNKAIANIDNTISVTFKQVVEMYDCELNFICKGYKENHYSSKQCNFDVLLNIYANELQSVINVPYNKEQLIQNINDVVLPAMNGLATHEYPIYLYLSKQENIINKNCFDFNMEKDLYFAYRKYEVISASGNKKEYIWNGYRYVDSYKYANESFKVNIGKCISEFYIPDSYTMIEHDAFPITSAKNDQYANVLVTVFGGTHLV